MKTGFLFLFLLSAVAGFSQKVIVVMGSSTSSGAGASTYDSSWAGRLTKYYQQNTTDGLDTVVQNIGLFGAVSYQEMPTGFVSPIANRPAPNPANNITRALSFNPNIVIINLPSNDVVNLTNPAYDTHELPNNLRTMYAAITATGAKCFITTSQPRNDINTTTNFFQRQQLRALVDSITNIFGTHAINFWDDLVSNDGLYSLRDDVRDPSSPYHLNNTGHRLVFNRVLARDIFGANIPLPLVLGAFTARLQGNSTILAWHTDDEESGTVFRVQHSSDGTHFETLASVPGRGRGDYSWTDATARSGKQFYRLQIDDPTGHAYSKILTVSAASLTVGQVYVQPGSLRADVFCARPQGVQCTLITMGGAVVEQKAAQLPAGSSIITFPLDGLPAGAYVLRLTAGDGAPQTTRFTVTH